MSIRTEPRNIEADLKARLTITPEAVQSATMAAAGLPPMDIAAAAGGPENHLNAANDFHSTNPDHPLTRRIMVNVRASLAELCLKSDKAVWKPVSAESTKAIFQQASRATPHFDALCNFLAPSLSVRRTRSASL